MKTCKIINVGVKGRRVTHTYSCREHCLSALERLLIAYGCSRGVDVYVSSVSVHDHGSRINAEGSIGGTYFEAGASWDRGSCRVVFNFENVDAPEPLTSDARSCDGSTVARGILDLVSLVSDGIDCEQLYGAGIDGRSVVIVLEGVPGVRASSVSIEISGVGRSRRKPVAYEVNVGDAPLRLRVRCTGRGKVVEVENTMPWLLDEDSVEAYKRIARALVGALRECKMPLVNPFNNAILASKILRLEKPECVKNVTAVHNRSVLEIALKKQCMTDMGAVKTLLSMIVCGSSLAAKMARYMPGMYPYLVASV